MPLEGEYESSPQQWVRDQVERYEATGGREADTLLDTGQVTVRDGPEPWDGVARGISGEERARWWEHAVAAYPPYAEYQQETVRQIPVLLVERRG